MFLLNTWKVYLFSPPLIASHQSSSSSSLSASQHPASLLSLLLAPSTPPAQRSCAAPPGAQPGPQPFTREPAGQPQHPDERAGRSRVKRRRTEPWLAGLVVHGVSGRGPAQHCIFLLFLQPLRHGGRCHVARLPVSQLYLRYICLHMFNLYSVQFCWMCVYGQSHSLLFWKHVCVCMYGL